MLTLLPESFTQSGQRPWFVVFKDGSCRFWVPKAWEPNILDTIKEAGIKLNYSTSGYSEKTNTN